ncbi:MAG: hypothetical protein GY771_13860 [bacterium]|nr:hypothetical protein [bacterium]
MKRAILFIVLLGMLIPTVASAIGFGGYYTKSYPEATFKSVDFEISFLGISGKGWYDINRNIALEAAINYSRYPGEDLIRLCWYPGDFLPERLDLWGASIGGRFGLPIAFLTPYVSAGVGLYHAIVTEGRFDPVEIHYNSTYPGIYVGAGTKVHLFGPVSLDVSPTYSYVFGTGGEGDRIERLSTFDLNVGMAVDL